MGTTTGIEWTDSTWSPIRARVKADAAAIARAKGYTSLVEIAAKMAGHVGQHCEHVSPGCLNCYAETNNGRCLPYNGTGLPYDRRSRDLVDAFVDEKVLLQPLKWRAVICGCEACGANKAVECECAPDFVKRGHWMRPRRIFVENQSDLFAEWVTDDMLDRVFAVMALCPQHVFQVLTKRPERMLAYVRANKASTPTAMRGGMAAALYGLDNGYFKRRTWDYSWPLPNVWLGVSVENQAAADERIPLLLKTPAAVRFISAEPLLGAVDLHPVADHTYRLPSNWYGPDWFDPTGSQPTKDRMAGYFPKLDWVICGGESGPGARPMHPDWARSLRDQCAAAGVPFFFKQWGEWKPISEMREAEYNALYVSNKKAPDEWEQSAFDEIHGRRCTVPLEYMNFGGERGLDLGFQVVDGHGGMTFFGVGKKAAGALLDGVEHKQFPRLP